MVSAAQSSLSHSYQHEWTWILSRVSVWIRVCELHIVSWLLKSFIYSQWTAGQRRVANPKSIWHTADALNPLPAVEPCLHFGHTQSVSWWQFLGEGELKPFEWLLETLKHIPSSKQTKTWAQDFSFLFNWALIQLQLIIHEWPHTHTLTHTHIHTQSQCIFMCAFHFFPACYSDCPLGIHLKSFYFHFVLCVLVSFRSFCCFYCCCCCCAPMSKMWTVCHFNWISMPRLHKANAQQ